MTHFLRFSRVERRSSLGCPYSYNDIERENSKQVHFDRRAAGDWKNSHSYGHGQVNG